MADLTLKTVTGTQGSTRALKDGTVAPRLASLEFEDVPVLNQAFRRMVRGLEFDVSEMAFTTYLCARAFGKPFTALPVFLVRAFHHGAIIRGASSAVRLPRDLEGRRAGVNRGYTVTGGVWARGILQDEYGVDLGQVTWMPSADDHVTEYQPPANVVPLKPGADLAGLVASGELPAAVGLTAGQDGVEPLIPDPGEAAFRALAERGLYPINHVLVVKDELLAAHPGLAADLFAAYAEAKNQYVERLGRGDIEDPAPADRTYRRVMDITGADPIPYGIAPNQDMIDLLVRYAVDQRILAGPVPAVDLFAAGTDGLTA